MDMSDKKYFCMVPFMQLNSRGAGDARICCSISGLNSGVPKRITIDKFNDKASEKENIFYNLKTDSVEEFWNGEFIRSLRVKLINGEKIKNCEHCYSLEKAGLTSKRQSKNKNFLEEYSQDFKEILRNNGFVTGLPVWWEVRLSIKCNLSCIMCSPNLSSKMKKEYEKWGGQKKLTHRMSRSLDYANEVGDIELGEDDFFTKQMLESLPHISHIELRGGEVFADKNSIRLIKDISRTEHAKNIFIDLSTNGTLITPEIIEILNNFKGGSFKISMDDIGRRDELIRYHTEFSRVEEALKLARSLKSGWTCETQTTVQLLNCLNLDEFLSYMGALCEKEKSNQFKMNFTIVRNRDWLKHDLLSLESRSKAVSKIEKLLDQYQLFNSAFNKGSIKGLMEALLIKPKHDPELKRAAVEYFERLSHLREKNYFLAFPQLLEIKG